MFFRFQKSEFNWAIVLFPWPILPFITSLLLPLGARDILRLLRDLCYELLIHELSMLRASNTAKNKKIISVL